MAVFTSPSDSFDYVLESDRDKAVEEQPVFQLGGLTEAQEREVSKMEGIRIPKYILVECGRLKGWRNLKDVNGNPVEFKDAQQGLDGLGISDRSELVSVIIARGGKLPEKALD